MSSARSSFFRTPTFVTYLLRLAKRTIPPEQLVLSTHAERAESMTTILLVGVAGFLVVIAIIVKARGRKPKKPEKWEKAQIVKQLLSLSEREEGIPRQQSVPQRPISSRRAAAASTSSSHTA
jgi:hypothetical protein